jgi:hypothetical protein
LPLQDAVPLVSSYPTVAVSYHAPLLRANLEARLCSLGCVNGLLRQQPRSKHLSFRNSFSSMTATFSAHPRPLGESAHLMDLVHLGHTQMFNLYL